jgi:AcrR family transcriptional regulator
MATRPYTTARRRDSKESVERVLEATERLIKDDSFHTATMDELAAAAGVSRATVFNRFGSKLGVLQALFTRGMEGPEMEAIREALAIEDPVAALEAVVEASCAIWETHGYIHEQLEAIAVLEPGASALIAEQRDEQRVEIQRLIRRLERAGCAPA